MRRRIDFVDVCVVFPLVADHVDTLMHVTREDVLRSSIKLLTGTERDEVLSDDIRSGLTN